MSSWEFFDFLLHNFSIVGTPGVVSGKNGEGFFPSDCFGIKENIIKAMERISKIKF